MSFSSHFATCNIFVMQTTMELHAHMNNMVYLLLLLSWYLKRIPLN